MSFLPLEDFCLSREMDILHLGECTCMRGGGRGSGGLRSGWGKGDLAVQGMQQVAEVSVS